MELHSAPESFAFVDGERTFHCCAETADCRPGAAHAETWWWFRVSSEARSRFAPFRAAPRDTPDVVRGRILAYYDDLLAARAAPVASRWRRRHAPAAAPVDSSPDPSPLSVAC
jgi:hypothetical protein